LMDFSSTSLQNAVDQLARLPGVGRKTAARLALHLLRVPEGQVRELAEALVSLKTNTHACKRCGNLADEQELCNICLNPSRKEHQICVVADLPDLLAVEKTGEFRGLYHVLGGLISPMDGIGPEELRVESLLERVEQTENCEVILALNARLEGETTAFYLSRRLEPLGVKMTSLARGVPLSSELEYADELTLARSLMMRQPYRHGAPAEED